MKIYLDIIIIVFLQTLITLDYVQLVGSLAHNDRTTQLMCEFICELALLQSDLGDYPQGQVASCSILLARLCMKKGMI